MVRITWCKHPQYMLQYFVYDCLRIILKMINSWTKNPLTLPLGLSNQPMRNPQPLMMLMCYDNVKVWQNRSKLPVSTTRTLLWVGVEGVVTEKNLPSIKKSGPQNQGPLIVSLGHGRIPFFWSGYTGSLRPGKPTDTVFTLQLWSSTLNSLTIHLAQTFIYRTRL